MNTEMHVRKRSRIANPDASMATILIATNALEPAYQAKSKTVTLVDVHPTDVENFIFWIYHQRFPDRRIDHSDAVNHWSFINDKGGRQMTRMISLYILCDKYDVPDLKKVLIDESFTHMDKAWTGLPAVRSIKAAFEKLPHNDPMCHLLVDIHSHLAAPNAWTDVGATGYSWAFASRVLERYASLMRGNLSMEKDLERCDYHGYQDKKGRDDCKRK
ncbi:hypothetical protein N0V86_006144 [Didymella sp. IMI 355093]|nr:hypothetical protein N0V86_006144 [Didymella sp. IMI 355093]